METSLVKEISVLSLKPDDMLVVKCEQCLSNTMTRRLKEELVTLLRRFGWENEVLVLHSGLTLEVARKEEP